jgi:hypothetical protein
MIERQVPIGSPGRELERRQAKRRKMLARALLKKLNENNCERYGVSKATIRKLRMAAELLDMEAKS